MTINEFETEVQNYYSKPWNPAQKKAVSQWLSKKSEKIIGLVFAELLKSFSTRYKTAPVIAEFEEALKLVKKSRSDEMSNAPEIKDVREGWEEFTENEIKDALSSLPWIKRG